MRPLTRAVLSASVLVLAGCSGPEPGSPLPTGGGVAPSAAPSPAPSTTSTGAPEPTAEPSATPTAEPSATPTAAPTLPPEATTNDAAGAEAFVRYWFDSVNYAYSTGDVEPMQAVSSAECKVCATISEEVQGYEADGLHYVGGRIRPREVVSPAPDGTGVGLVAVAYEQQASSVLDGQGGEIASADPREVSINAVIQREGDAWTLFDLGS